MSPALLPNGSLVFASPVPKIGGTHSGQPPSALYVQAPGSQPRRLTFSPYSITEPTMLADGRILFVSTQPAESSKTVSGPALYTINNDGTEITAFAGPEDPDSTLQQPRLLADGRVVYLVSKAGSDSPGGTATFVRMARPFQSRAPLFPQATARVRSVESANNGDLLVCAENCIGHPGFSGVVPHPFPGDHLGLAAPGRSGLECLRSGRSLPPSPAHGTAFHHGSHEDNRQNPLSEREFFRRPGGRCQARGNPYPRARRNFAGKCLRARRGGGAGGRFVSGGSAVGRAASVSRRSMKMAGSCGTKRR